TTVWAVAVWAGFGIIAAGLVQFATGSMLEGIWKGLAYGLGGVALVVGFMCLIWPSETFLVLAALIGWYLMFKGIIDIIMALRTRGEDNLLWSTPLRGFGK